MKIGPLTPYMETLKMSSVLMYIALGFISISTYGQNTIGTVFYNTPTAQGYTLFTVHTQTYLINNCGQVVNEWTSEFPPGNAVYLLEDGDILRAGNTGSSTIRFGGSGGVVERYNWEGTLEWQYFYDTDQHRQHHDIYPMPNGNVLILAATLITEDEAIAAGRNPDKLKDGFVYNERIIEVRPVGADNAEIVWEWNFMDHIIQDFDSTKANYGTVSSNPQLVDFNYTNDEEGEARWLHINSIQYYEEVDQIILSSRNLSEIYIIDHSTTTEEAATGTGGLY
ncbi:MAG: aryl-sulfate sulfotransferase, partial [Flavobacteriaceae bacterium]|nr:aryl-sulfate sulfotransferase [Flavobacteriaceae bacterium]